jgi:hypothetical protein
VDPVQWRWAVLVVWSGALACFNEDTPLNQPTTTGDEPPGSTGVMPGASSGAVDSTGDPEASTGSVDATSDGSTSMSDTGPPMCLEEGSFDEMCPDGAPYCTDGMCRPCPMLPGGCASIDPAEPICDPGTGTCAACTEHDQCDSGACRIATGECFGETNRLFVSASADCMAGQGTQMAPFCGVDEALAVVAGQAGVEPWAIFVGGSAVPYVLPGDAALIGRPLALIGPAEGVAARLMGSPPSSLLVATAPHDSYLARVTLDGAASDTTALRCLNGDLWIDDTEIRNGTTGLEVVDCDVRLRRSHITETNGWGVVVGQTAQLTATEVLIDVNVGGVSTIGTTTLRRSRIADNYLWGGISAPDGTLTLTNSVMAANVYAIGHIDIGTTTVASLNYVTAIGDPLSCAGAAATYSIRNSIVDNITCAGQVTVDQSLVAIGDEGLGNGNVGFPPSDYALVFDDHPAGELHIRPGAPAYLLGIATRAPTDPALDFDGDPRPPVGDPDYPGFDTVP